MTLHPLDGGSERAAGAPPASSPGPAAGAPDERTESGATVLPFRTAAAVRASVAVGPEAAELAERTVGPGAADVAATVAASIDARALTRRFGEVTAVDALTLIVRRGETFGLLGPNGAGKTTTIKMLITLLPPTAGSASVVGHDIVRDQRAVRRSIGYVPQLLSSDGALTARENLMTTARLYHLPASVRRQRIAEALEFTGLGDAADRLVRTFSGGMIRRLEIAQAMLHQPEALFLDEPTVGLDPVARRAVWEHVRSLREAGTTILLTTHYMDEAAELCERIGIMHLGHLVALGTPEELCAQVGPGATLDDAFTHFTGAGLSGNGAEGGTYRDVARTRRTARRLG